jgi:Pvc16 N-terminal domain
VADFRAVAAVTETVLQLLRSNYQPSDFDQELEFKVYTAKDFTKPLNAGVSLFLYRIFPNGVQRTPPSRPTADGRRFPPLLPLDLHMLLTVWGREASLQHTIAGWMMRTLEDQPIFPAALLNASTPGVFRPDETIELSLTELTNEDLLRIWDALVQNVYQLSVPYVARVVRIESTRPLPEGGGLVQERLLRAAELESAGGVR